MSWTSAESWLLHTAVGGGLLLLLALVLMRLIRQPVRRQRLGEWGLGAALLVAVASLGPSWFDLSSLTSTQETPLSVVVEPPLAQALPADAVAVNEPFALDVPVAAPVAPEAPQSSLLETLRPWLFWIFSVGAVLFLGHWLLGYVVLNRLLRDTTLAPRGVAELFREMCGSRRGRLLVSDRLPVPLSCGLIDPVIVVPRSMCEPPDFDKLRWVFAHELTHLERRDAWSNVLFGLGQTIYFYLPWFWSLRRQVRLCQEYIADASAIQAVAAAVETPTEAAADYAEFLLSLTKSPAVPVAAAGVSGNTSDLFRRVSMLLQNPLRIERRCSQIWSLITGGVLLTAAILLGGIGLTAEASDAADETVELTADEVQILKTKVPVRVLLADEGGAAQGERKVKVFVLKPGEQPQVDVIIKKEPGQEKKILIQRVVTGIQPKVHVVTSGEKQLDPLRKALESLEKSGTIDPAQIRQQVMKALEAIKSVPKADPAKEHRIEIRILIDKDNKITVTQPQAATPPAPPTTRALIPPPIPKINTAPAPTVGYRALAMPVAHDDAGALAKAIEKLVKEKGTSDADTLAKSLQKLIKEVHEKKSAASGQLKIATPYMARFTTSGGKIDFEKVRKLVEELEKSPGDTKKLHELLQSLGKGAAGQGAYFYVPHVVPTLPTPPAAPAPPKQPKLEVKGLPGGQGVIVGDGGTIVLGGGKVFSGKSGQSRLGIVIDQPSALLADQLNLPKGQGLVIADVKADSPAAKAGLKANDILLELNKQKVPSNAGDFIKIVAGLKPGATVDAVVLRRGKRETVSGITLAEAPSLTRTRAIDALKGLAAQPGSKTISISASRDGDRFTTRYQDGALNITVTGAVKDNKATAESITIQDGATTHKHANVNDVPAQYRDRINQILEISGKSEVRIENK